jgi:KTSC domain
MFNHLSRLFGFPRKQPDRRYTLTTREDFVMFIPVTNSSVISGYKFNRISDSEGTFIVRMTNDSVYAYPGVSPEEFAAFEAAPSKGSWFSRNISSKRETADSSYGIRIR